MNVNLNFRNFVLLFCVIILGLGILWPFHDFQANMAPGDNGRDLYGYKKTLEGTVPYQDHWREYGPLMPYYYKVFLLLLGYSIKSVLIGKLLLILVSGLCIFLTLRSIIAPFLACVAALWF